MFMFDFLPTEREIFPLFITSLITGRREKRRTGRIIILTSLKIKEAGGISIRCCVRACMRHIVARGILRTCRAFFELRAMPLFDALV